MERERTAGLFNPICLTSDDINTLEKESRRLDIGKTLNTSHFIWKMQYEHRSKILEEMVIKFRRQFISFFKPFHHDLVEKIYPECQHLCFIEDEILLQSGSSSEGIYFILKGRVAAFHSMDRHLPLLIYKEGSFVGDTFLIHETSNREFRAASSQLHVIYMKASLLSRIESSNLRKILPKLRAASLYKHVVQIVEEVDYNKYARRALGYIINRTTDQKSPNLGNILMKASNQKRNRANTKRALSEMMVDQGLSDFSLEINFMPNQHTVNIESIKGFIMRNMLTEEIGELYDFDYRMEAQEKSLFYRGLGCNGAGISSGKKGEGDQGAHGSSTKDKEKDTVESKQ